MRRRVFPILLGLWALGRGLAAEQLWSGLYEGHWRIYGASSPAGPLEMLGFPRGTDYAAPSLSPDGSRVAVEVAGYGVGVCVLESGACTLLEGLPGVAARPTWNPRTGDLLFAVYTVEEGSEDSDLWVVGRDLKNPERLVTQTGNQDDPDVSPDGRKLIYSSTQTVLLGRAAVQVVRHLWTMDLATGRARLVAAGAFQDQHPDWSPEGQRVAFASNRSGEFEIWVIDLEGGEPRQVTSGEGSKTWPAWSPDGQSLLFTLSWRGRYALREVRATGPQSSSFAPPGSDFGGQRRDADWR